jgi:hypothetical protein
LSFNYYSNYPITGLNLKEHKKIIMARQQWRPFKISAYEMHAVSKGNYNMLIMLVDSCHLFTFESFQKYLGRFLAVNGIREQVVLARRKSICGVLLFSLLASDCSRPWSSQKRGRRTPHHYFRRTKTTYSRIPFIAKNQPRYFWKDKTFYFQWKITRLEIVKVPL